MSNDNKPKQNKKTSIYFIIAGIILIIAIVAGIFWMKKNELPLDDDSLNNLTQGMYQRPELITYMKILIETWDEIIPIINLNRSKREIIINDFGLLYFTDQSRSLFDANMNK